MNHEDGLERSGSSVRFDETSPEEEAAAQTMAMPLRRVLGTKHNYEFYILECGHSVETNSYLGKDTHARCWDCYLDGLQKARTMTEGIQD